MVKSYNVSYYETSREELESAKRMIPTMRKSAYNADTLAQVSLAEQAYSMESVLFDAGINKFMYRRELDDYVSNPENGVKLRRIEDYNRLIPMNLIPAVNAIKSNSGEVLVLSFNEEEVSASPANYIRNSLLSDSVPEVPKVPEVKFKPAPRQIDPILFGILRLGGKVWEKVWILGAWLNNYPSISTSESIVAYLNGTFSRDTSTKFRLDETMLAKA